MANSHFLAHAGNFGEVYSVFQRTLPTTVVGAAATVRHVLPIAGSAVTAFPNLFYFKDGSVCIGGAAMSLTGTTTARAVKRNSAGTITPLSGSVTISGTAAQFTIHHFPNDATISDGDRTIRPNSGDLLLVEFTNAAGVLTTQPGDVQAAVRVTVLK
jgi:hypothetical protein